MSREEDEGSWKCMACGPWGFIFCRGGFFLSFSLLHELVCSLRIGDPRSSYYLYMVLWCPARREPSTWKGESILVIYRGLDLEAIPNSCDKNVSNLARARCVEEKEKALREQCTCASKNGPIAPCRKKKNKCEQTLRRVQCAMSTELLGSATVRSFEGGAER